MSKSNGPLPIKNLESVLQETLDSPLKIEDVEWKHLTDPGENFGSLIMAIDLTVAKDGIYEKAHLVAKLPPKSEYLIDLFNSPVSFHKEIYFYRIIAPELIKFQLENMFQKDELTKLVPRFFGGRLGLNNAEKFDDQATIILENLKIQGYDTKDRILGMDKEHMEYAVKQLARFHAIPISYRLKKPKAFNELILPGLKSIINEAASACVQDMVNRAMTDLQRLKEAKPHLERVVKTLEYGTAKVNSEPEQMWATIVHNDFWVNNMLYQHDKNGRIIDMKIVDLQLTRYGNGCADLVFFLLSSASTTVINDNFDDLIDLYFESFVDCLKTFDVDVNDFTREEFDERLKECARRTLAQCIMMVQVIQATRGTAHRVDDIKDKENFLGMGKGKIYNEKLLHILQTYVQRGWLMD